ncbi:MAG: NADH-quinone oxidoreductase subunit NuoK [Pseudomonadota bacterium]
MIVPLSHVLAVSFLLFGIGVAGLFLRRDAITVFLSVEILLNAANVAFIGFAANRGDEFGHVAAFIVIATAAAEAAVGLSIVIQVSKKEESLNLSALKDLKG